MTLVRRIARPLLASMFVYGGLDQVRHPEAKLGKAEPFIARVREPLHLPDDPKTLVRANGGVMVGAGLLFAAGKAPRLSALAMIATLVPTTYAGHAFWEEKDPAARRTQTVQFLKNAGLVGGLLLAAVDTEGRPGLAWRSQRAGKDAKKLARSAAKDARRASSLAKKDAGHLAKSAKREAKVAARDARQEVRIAKAKVEAASPL